MKYEDIEDILREMREKAKECPFVLFVDVEIFADRIEAAWKRERAAMHNCFIQKWCKVLDEAAGEEKSK